MKGNHFMFYLVVIMVLTIGSKADYQYAQESYNNIDYWEGKIISILNVYQQQWVDYTGENIEDGEYEDIATLGASVRYIYEKVDEYSFKLTSLKNKYPCGVKYEGDKYYFTCQKYEDGDDFYVLYFSLVEHYYLPKSYYIVGYPYESKQDYQDDEYYYLINTPWGAEFLTEFKFEVFFYFYYGVYQIYESACPYYKDGYKMITLNQPETCYKNCPSGTKKGKYMCIGQICPEGCAACSSLDYCTYCKSDYIFNGHTCVKGNKWVGKYISFKSYVNDKYCDDDHNIIKCNKGKAQSEQKYEIIRLDNGTIALKGQSKDQYCGYSDDDETIKCNDDSYKYYDALRFYFDDDKISVQQEKSGKYWNCVKKTKKFLWWTQYEYIYIKANADYYDHKYQQFYYKLYDDAY